ncbi:sulfotransferase family protein [Amylibacter sp.]|nr:sulfotransferase family protein [Amylibacter sp.]
MISHKYKFIYVHINHCGGTSIEYALRNVGEMRPANIDHITRADILNDQLPLAATQHLTALELKRFYGDKIWNEYFTFAFVANPFDRMTTAFLQRGKPFYGHDNILDFFHGPYCNVSDSIPAHIYLAIAYTAPRVQRMVRSSHFWLSDENNNMLDFNFIGRKESLDRDFQVVLNTLGIRGHLGQSNKTKNKQHYSTYYNTQAVKWVEERMAEDLEHFDYSFDGTY